MTIKKKKSERIFKTVRNVKMFLENLEEHKTKPALKYLEGKNQYKTVTYEEFLTLIKNEIAGLDAVGLKGARVAIIGDTSVQWLATYIAVLASGGVAIPMDKELDIEAIKGFLEVSEAKAVVYSKSFNEKFATILENHKSLKALIPIDGEGDGENIIPYSSLIEKGALANEASPVVIEERDPEALAVMLFTSGTTGTSKCVMLCEKNVFSTVQCACESVEFSGDDVILSVLPIHHTYELACLIAAFNYGALIGINDSLKRVTKNLAEIKPTGLVLVPLIINTMYGKIMSEIRKQKKEKLVRFLMKLSNFLRKFGIDLRPKLFSKVLGAFGGRINKIISGAAPLNPQMVRDFDALGITICEGYGITECSPLISVNPYYAVKPGTVGPTVSSCKARIASNGKNDRGFEEGEIQVIGKNVMLGYYNNDEENAKAFTEDGWYRTGDVGYIDEDGYIHITGRMKSVIVLENGKNVFPEEIEEYLADIPEIAECVVVGRKAEDGETVLLTVIAILNTEIFGENPDKEAAHKVIYDKLLDLNRKLPSFKHIKGLEIREEPFEKTTTKKIKRHLVK